MKYLTSMSLFFVLTLCVGCGSGSPVSGTVTFSDGAPLDTGRVVFESSSGTYMGTLTPQGKYTLLGDKGKPGIPNGEYEVYIAGAEKGVDMEANPDADPDAPPTPLIDKKFTKKNTSNLKCDVKGKTVYDIPVEKP